MKSFFLYKVLFFTFQYYVYWSRLFEEEASFMWIESTFSDFRYI
ncbi:hypothetical protein KIS4809_4123 [Bacillus sp. ZZV12-4809]|nr:hypothetical protein KIS4809_4123 [Bacillus sp. ZZV12-4809]